MLYKIKTLEELRKVKNIWYEDMEKWENSISRWTYRDIIAWRRKPTENSISKIAMIFWVEEKEIIRLLK